MLPRPRLHAPRLLYHLLARGNHGHAVCLHAADSAACLTALQPPARSRFALCRCPQAHPLPSAVCGASGAEPGGVAAGRAEREGSSGTGWVYPAGDFSGRLSCRHRGQCRRLSGLHPEPCPAAGGQCQRERHWASLTPYPLANTPALSQVTEEIINLLHVFL